MLQFRSVASSDIPVIKKIFNSFNEFSCEFSAVNLILWQKQFGFSFCIEDGVLYSKNCIDSKVSFGIPFSHDMPSAIGKLKEYCRKENIPLVLFGAQGERMYILKEQMHNMFAFEAKRDSFEYIYSRENLAQLSGKKYHSKRNHISSFKKKYNWSYETLNDENSGDVLEMLRDWYSLNKDKEDEFMLSEKRGLEKILGCQLIPEVKGGVLRVDGKVVAFTLGCEISKEIFDVNIEKALTDFDGAYAMINQQFVSNELCSYKYVNREEDMGLEGLRKAKLSYRPEILLEKYVVTVEENNG